MDPTKARLDFIRRVEERHFELWKVCCFSQGAMHKMEVSAGVQGKISDCHWSRGWRSLGFCKTTCDRWWHWWSTVLTHWLQQSKLRWDLLREALQCRTEGLIVGGCLTEFCQIHLYIYMRMGELKLKWNFGTIIPINFAWYADHVIDLYTLGPWPCCKVEMHHCSGYLMSQFFDR